MRSREGYQNTTQKLTNEHDSVTNESQNHTEGVGNDKTNLNNYENSILTGNCKDKDKTI